MMKFDEGGMKSDEYQMKSDEDHTGFMESDEERGVSFRLSDLSSIIWLSISR